MAEIYWVGVALEGEESDPAVEATIDEMAARLGPPVGCLQLGSGQASYMRADDRTVIDLRNSDGRCVGFGLVAYSLRHGRTKLADAAQFLNSLGITKPVSVWAQHTSTPDVRPMSV